MIHVFRKTANTFVPLRVHIFNKNIDRFFLSFSSYTYTYTDV